MDYNNVVIQWDSIHRHSPAPRHRRRIILNMLRGLEFESVLDVGCAQAFLLDILAKRKKKTFGCDISNEVIEFNRKNFPDSEFARVNIENGVYPDDKKFDLIICSEVIEHIQNWEKALENLMKMCNKYIVVTVPAGKMHKIDEIVGHVRHYNGNELIDTFKKMGFETILCKHWGFPFHTIYKYAINSIAPEKIYDSFTSSEYGLSKKAISNFLYYLFYLNDFFGNGSQLILLTMRLQ